MGDHEVILATMSMVASDDMWMHLEHNTQPFSRIVEQFVVRAMRRHSSFEDFSIRYRREPLPEPIDGYCILVWEAYR